MSWLHAAYRVALNRGGHREAIGPLVTNSIRWKSHAHQHIPPNLLAITPKPHCTKPEPEQLGLNCFPPNPAHNATSGVWAQEMFDSGELQAASSIVRWFVPPLQQYIRLLKPLWD